MKERAKRAGAQRKEEESERKSMQVIVNQCMLFILIKDNVFIVLISYISFTLPIWVIYFLSFRPSWNSQRVNSEVCLRSSRA